MGKIHERFLSMVSKNGNTRGVSYASFIKILGLNSGKTPLMERVFRQMDLNDSGELDFLQFLHGCWNLCPLSSDKEVLRMLFQVYSGEKNRLPFDQAKVMLREMHGAAYCPKMWGPFKDKLESAGAAGGKSSWSQFKEATKTCGALLLPAHAMRDELAARFFGEELWSRGRIVRGRTKDKYNLQEVKAVRDELTGAAKVAKKAQKATVRDPVQHRGEHLGSVKVGRSTLLKHYKTSARAKVFATKQEFKARVRPDIHYEDFD